MITHLLIVLTLAFGGLGLPVKITKVDQGRIFYSFGDTRYYGTCTPAAGRAYAQDINLLDHHIFTTVATPGCVVAVAAG